MKIGDKVRFLNSTGGGIVRGFQGKDIAIVDDDGFDTPVLIRECVVIEPTNEAQVRQSVKQSSETIISEYKNKSEPARAIEETKEGEQITACLAYLPVDIKKLSTSNYECYLVNDSNYFLAYSYMNRCDSGWLNRVSGIVEPNTKIFLDEFSKEEINDLEKVAVQFIAYKTDKPFKLKKPCLVELNIDTVKFYKLHSFKENDYFEDEAIIYVLMRNDLAVNDTNVSGKTIEEAMMSKNVEQTFRPRIQSVNKKAQSSILEIDLHIDELIDTTLGMDAANILEYQLSKFREVMDENKLHKGQRIVFIHGKGDGVLKNSILDELKHKYKSAYYQDASFREYGFGATMVTIK